MCGIFGIIPGSNKVFDASTLVKLTRRLFIASERRGKDASGIAILNNVGAKVIKYALRSKALVASKPFRDLTDDLRVEHTAGHVIMGHTRMVTNGDSGNPDNNQPAVKHGIICLHNGIIVNDGALWTEMTDRKRLYEVDTEAFLELIATEREQGANHTAAICRSIIRLKGANSFAVACDDSDTITLATTNGSLYITELPGGGTIFASESSILEECVKFVPNQSMPLPQIRQIAPGTGCAVSVATGACQLFNLVDARSWPTSNTRPAKRSLIIHGERTNKISPMPQVGRLLKLENACRIDMDKILALRRCTRCILPETFPFIEFDEQGVCSQCRAHKPLTHFGIDRLRSDLDRHRSTRGGPDCLIPISGGRDSCYSLHLIKKELGLNPIAYTYDWGMVTDLARRNISRMCGSLGIEHILIAADIKGKRENIRKNVVAWLNKPHLGTVPLFMAGDKHFFLFAQKLRVQMGLGTVVFGMNRLERTDFKVGFCGINENKNKDQKRHYNMSQLNKLRMLYFYARQGITNPRLLNSTILDSLVGFASYYFIPKVFLSIFDYVPWQEQNINEILLNQYDWETASDTKSTWRIGDGTAPFYNYIYLKMAGLTENDTLQSNKIREGLTTREAALKAIRQDNQPRIESLAWYCDAIGIDPIAAVERINLMPTRY